MQTVEIRLWDDLHAKQGEKIPSDVQVTLEYKGKRRRLDLTTAHAEELDKLLAPWMEAGQSPDAPPVTAHKAGSVEAREFYAGLRAWAASVGRTDEHYTSGKNGQPRQFYYPRKLVADYEEHLRSLAERKAG